MDFKKYQAEAKRTMKESGTFESNVSEYALGICGESGEVADYLKKVLFHGHDFDVNEVKGELGDVLWYASALATVMNIDLAEVAQMNIDKLRKRYPAGFNATDSVKRVDTKQSNS